ncbi:hypothetical protein ACFO4O_10595 [Glaciecola siphonariae]|uniref:Uncharacterized protein n=1 Tax=Glaciecola siphonariae TaxID=521012 RepID=A0ABV9LWR1_9ALTE
MKTHTANHIPLSVRIFNILWAILLIGFGLYVYFEGSFSLPGRRGSGPTEFEGIGLLLFSASLGSAALNALITVIDHYDRRNNESEYRKISVCLNVVSLILIISAFSYEFVDNQKPPVIISNGS